MGKSRRLNKKKENTIDNKKWFNIVGFCFSIGLLCIAIVLSVNQDKIDKLASASEYSLSNTTMSASSGISKSVNDVVSDRKIVGEPGIVNSIISNEVNEIKEEEQKEDEENLNVAKYVFDNKENDSQDSIEKENYEENEDSKKEIKQFIMPVNGDIYKEYSMDGLIYSDTLQEWVTHRGVDFQVNLSDDVKASASGTVKSIKNDPRYGWSIILEHKDGFSTIYTCLVDVSLVSEGDSVEQGQIIAKAGNSGVFEYADGSHLHFEMMKDGKYINPEMYIK